MRDNEKILAEAFGPMLIKLDLNSHKTPPEHMSLYDILDGIHEEYGEVLKDSVKLNGATTVENLKALRMEFADLANSAAFGITYCNTMIEYLKER
jgi:hypothetical protein